MPGFSGINGYFSFRYQVRATLVLQNTPKLVPGCKIPFDSGIRRGIPREGDNEKDILKIIRGKEVRKSYGKLGDIRDKFGKKPPWFVTSATLPNAQLKTVLASLRIEDAKEINENLDRPNIYYNVVTSFIGDRFRGIGTTPLDYVVEFGTGPVDPKTIKQKPFQNPKLLKTLIYFDSIATLGAFMYHLRHPLFLRGVPHRMCSRLIQSYFAIRAPEAKDAVRQDFKAGTALIVLATETFGMGMDISDIVRVYNWGIPRSLASLIQRFGRGARDPKLTAICTIILPKYCSTLDPHREKHPEAPSEPLESNARGPHKGENHSTKALKIRNEDLYNFLHHYCMRRGIMEFLTGSDADYYDTVSVLCCSHCSKARFESNFKKP